MFKLPTKKNELLKTCIRLGAGKVEDGYIQFKMPYRRNVQAFYNKKLGIVVKMPSIIVEPRTPLSLRAPTIALGNKWVCQPILKRNALKRAQTHIEKKLEKHYLSNGMWPDVHSGNVGWLGNKAVLLDW